MGDSVQTRSVDSDLHSPSRDRLHSCPERRFVLRSKPEPEVGSVGAVGGNVRARSTPHSVYCLRTLCRTGSVYGPEGLLHPIGVDSDKSLRRPSFGDSTGLPVCLIDLHSFPLSPRVYFSQTVTISLIVWRTVSERHKILSSPFNKTLT